MDIIQSFFGNKSLNIYSKELLSVFKNKKILVTGGCGSIGSEIVKQLLRYKPKKILVYDNDEASLFYLQQKINNPILQVLLGDIRDKERLRTVTRGCEIVFHAAALKHVPLCEYNPFEAVSTNVIGTQNLVTACREEKVDKLIAISTDKAVNPINTMGATKLLSEKIVMTANIEEGIHTKFSCVRFGNVLNSVGSVIPIFLEQIKQGGPVTITDPKMERFFMSMSEAVHLVLQSALLSEGGEIFVLKMKKLNILDLAQVMIEEYSEKFGYNPVSISIKNIGIRPGEKLNEQLVTDEEKHYLINMKDVAIIRPAKIHPYQSSNKVFNPRNRTKVDINNGVLLSKNEIRDTLHKVLGEDF